MKRITLLILWARMFFDTLNDMLLFIHPIFVFQKTLYTFATVTFGSPLRKGILT